MDEVERQMDRRKPGKNKMSTARKEDDKTNIVSGFLKEELLVPHFAPI